MSERDTVGDKIIVLVSQRERRQENSPGDRRILVLVSQRVRRQENSRLGESESKETGE